MIYELFSVISLFLTVLLFKKCELQLDCYPAITECSSNNGHISVFVLSVIWIGVFSLLPRIYFLSIGILKQVALPRHVGAPLFETGIFCGQCLAFAPATCSPAQMLRPKQSDTSPTVAPTIESINGNNTPLRPPEQHRPVKAALNPRARSTSTTAFSQ